MSFFQRAARKVGGFGLATILSGIVSLLAIPVLIRFAGADGWSAVAIGQSVGAMVGVLTGLGWLQTGPTEVARADRLDQASIYRDSLTSRLATLVVTVPLAAIIAFSIAPAYQYGAALVAIATVSLNLSAAWFFIGIGSPSKLLLFDTLPRLLGIVVGALLTVFSGSIFSYGAALLVGAILATSLASSMIRREYGSTTTRWYRTTWKHLASLVSGQLHGLGIAVFSTVYLSVPLLFLASVQPAATATYALADKLKQQAMTAVSPMSQALQGWVPRGITSALRTRVVAAWRVALALGLVGGVAFALVGPGLSSLLGAGTVQLGLSLTIPMGIAFGLNTMSLITGASCLMALGLKRDVLISAAIGMVVVIPLLFLLTAEHQEVGTAWAVAFAQASVAGYQFARLGYKLLWGPRLS